MRREGFELLALKTRVALALPAALAISACTLLWPVDELALTGGDGGGGSADANATPDVDGATSDGGDGAESGSASDSGVATDASPTTRVVEVFANVGTSPRLVATNANDVFVVGADEKVTRIRKASRVVETVPTPTAGYNSASVQLTDLGADDQRIFISGNEAGSCGVPALAWKRSTGDGGSFTEIFGGNCKSMAALANDPLDLAVAVVSMAGSTSILLHSLGGAGGNRTLARALPVVSAMHSLPDEVFVASASAKSILRVPKTADAGIELASTIGSARDLVADAANVYWIEDEGTVMRVPRNGMAPLMLTLTAAGLSHLAADAANLYFTNIADGSVRTVPKSGGVATLIATQQSQPSDIAVDESGIYWVNEGDGTLMRAYVP